MPTAQARAQCKSVQCGVGRGGCAWVDNLEQAKAKEEDGIGVG